MGLNWSEGLNQLSQGLGTLAQHAIYKDEVARKERLQAAQQQYQERLLALKERTSEAQISQGQERLDIAHGEAEFMQDYRTQSLELQGQQIEGINALREQQARLAELQADILEKTASGEGGTQFDKDRETSWLNWNKHFRDTRNDLKSEIEAISESVTMDDNTKAAQMEALQAELEKIDRMNARVGARLGYYSADDLESISMGPDGEEPDAAGGVGDPPAPPGPRGGGDALPEIPPPPSGAAEAGAKVTSKARSFLENLPGDGHNKPSSELVGRRGGEPHFNLPDFLRGMTGSDQRTLMAAVQGHIQRSGPEGAVAELIRKGYGHDTAQEIVDQAMNQ